MRHSGCAVFSCGENICLPMNHYPRERKAPHQLKILMWSVLFGLTSLTVWLGSNSVMTNAAGTSSTKTVTVNATVAGDIEIYIDDTTINLNVTSPGSMVTDTNQIKVWTNCENGYKLFQSHNNNLLHTDTSTIINPNLPGSVDAPIVYSHNGLGFSLNGSPVESLWNDGANFSTFYDSTTEANCYASYSATNTVINVIYKLDVTTTQKAGTYSNEIYWYGVAND